MGTRIPVAQPARSQDRHGQVADGADDLAVLAERRRHGLALVLVATAMPREGPLEGAVVAQQAHLQVSLEEADLGDLVEPVDAVADRAHQRLCRVVVLAALGRGELQHADALPQARQLDDVLGAAQAECLKEHDEAILDDGEILDVLLKRDLDPFAEDGCLGEGLDADEGKESAKVGELVLNWRPGKTPP